MQRRAPSRSSFASRFVGIIAAALTAVLFAACGEEPATEPPEPVIVREPEDGAVFQGQTAFFQVRASGAALAYQWSRDGTPIPGATDSHYTTPPTEAGDDGSTYRVAVTADGSAPTPSRAARLTVHPPLDLRFKGVGAPVELTFVPLANILGFMTRTIEGFGGPLLVGEGLCAPAPPEANCSWDLSWHPRFPGLQTTYQAGLLSNFETAWVEALPPIALVTSLDLEEGANAFAAAILRTTQTGTFTPVFGAVPLDQLPATAATEGAAGRVLTAVSFQGGLVTYLSYFWSEASAERYETQVAATAVADAASAAVDLAAQGYIITALGAGNSGENGVVMVGTRRQGDTAPRDLHVQVVGGYFSSPPGYAAVGSLAELAPFAHTMLFER